MGRRARSRIMLAVAALAVLVAAPPAAADKIAGGATRIQLDPTLLAGLRERGIRIEALAPAKFGRGVLVLPVAGGTVYTPRHGFISLAGRVRLRSPGGRAVLGSFVINCEDRHLRSSIGGSYVRMVTVPNLRVREKGFETTAALGPLRLTPKAARRLGHKLAAPGLFRPGMALGTGEMTSHVTDVGVSGTMEIRFAGTLAGPRFTVLPGARTTLLAGSPAGLKIPISGEVSLAFDAGEMWAEQSGFSIAETTGPSPRVFELSRLAFSPAGILEARATDFGPLAVAEMQALAPGALRLLPRRRGMTLAPTPAVLFDETAEKLTRIFAPAPGEESPFAAGEAFATFSFDLSGE